MFYQPIFFKMGSMGSGCGWAGREVASGTRGLQFESNHWRNFAQTIYFKRYLSKIKEKEDENGSFFKKQYFTIFKKWQHRFLTFDIDNRWRWSVDVDDLSPNDRSVLGRYRHLLIFICFLKYEPNPASFIYFRPFQNTMTNTVQNLIITA